jgi:hypothetical protein
LSSNVNTWEFFSKSYTMRRSGYKKTLRFFFRASVLCLLTLVLAGCSLLLLNDETVYVEIERTERMLLLVDEALYPSLTEEIDQYVQDLMKEGCAVYVEKWRGGSADDLKHIIRLFYEQKGIGGAFIVGWLPAFWYEQSSFGRHEEFPCDLCYMDMDAQWEDEDRDGIFDSHSPLGLDIFFSRVTGTAEELKGYFDKLHRYRNGGMMVHRGAYIFKDDDWADYERGSRFGINDIYETVEICDAPGETVRSCYLSKLVNGGAEYVYQWIHAYPPLLCIEDDGSYEYVFTSDIRTSNTKGLFYNLFNCSASRFTETNIAMTYLMDTDYGLATHGSTKVGGNYYPKVFHYVLSRGGSWGEAYKAWYNNFGVTDDRWFLGMVILGDPMLSLRTVEARLLKTEPMTSIPPSEETVRELVNTFFGFAEDYGEGSFARYKEENPRFFPE